jgi:hypothetical protein
MMCRYRIQVLEMQFLRNVKRFIRLNELYIDDVKELNIYSVQYVDAENDPPE